MIQAIFTILLCQLAGETLSRSLGLPIPGPVLGMAVMLAVLLGSKQLRDLLRPVAQGILKHMTLLFIPASVGAAGQFMTLGAQTWAIVITIVASALLAILASAGTFVLVARLTGNRDTEEEAP